MLILICGYPRAGKTTYSKHFENTHTTIIHFDYHPSFKNIIKSVKENNTQDIVIDGVYQLKQKRKQLAEAYEGKTRCIFIDTDLETRKSRAFDFYQTKMYKNHFNVPTYDQGWDQIYILKNGVLTKM